MDQQPHDSFAYRLSFRVAFIFGVVFVVLRSVIFLFWRVFVGALGGAARGIGIGRRINSGIDGVVRPFQSNATASEPMCPDCHRELERRVTNFYCHWCRKTWTY